MHIKKRANCLPKGITADVLKDVAVMTKLSDQFQHGLDQSSHINVPVSVDLPQTTYKSLFVTTVLYTATSQDAALSCVDYRRYPWVAWQLDCRGQASRARSHFMGFGEQPDHDYDTLARSCLQLPSTLAGRCKPAILLSDW